MNEKAKNALMLVLIVGVVLATATLAFGWFGWIPNPTPPPPPGNEPTITFETTVNMFNPIIGDPYVDYINVEQISVSGLETENPKLLILPWEGTLKVKVVYPQGQISVQSKSVKIELNGGLEATFVWMTKQSGEHKVIAELYNKEGKLVNTNSITFTPERW